MSVSFIGWMVRARRFHLRSVSGQLTTSMRGTTFGNQRNLEAEKAANLSAPIAAWRIRLAS
jgi:hypothetical protein